MLETLRCPSCSTRFGLRASRVHARIRRARCFRCDTVFGIEDAVARLLAPVPPEAAPAPHEEVPLPEMDLAGIPEAPLPAQEAAEAAAPEEALPTLSPGDLEALEAPSEEEGAGNFSSAKDAIAKLMGAAPTPPVQPRLLGSRSSMDVEATLDALDSTLGGTSLPPRPPVPAAPAGMASTLKLSAEEIQAALAAGTPERMPVQPPPRMEPPPLAAQTHPFGTPLPPTPSQDLNLLKVQLEQETCHNVTLEQMTAWIEQGRVQEYHMVARQFSDNWIEASKVPALRPLFDQRRRLQTGAPEEPPAPPAEVAPVKRGLFGGLFSRN